MSELETGLWLLGGPVVAGIIAFTLAWLVHEGLFIPLLIFVWLATSFGFIFYGLFS